MQGGEDGYETRLLASVRRALEDAERVTVELHEALADMAARREARVLRRLVPSPTVLDMLRHAAVKAPDASFGDWMAWVAAVEEAALSGLPAEPLDPVQRTIEVVRDLIRENPGYYGELGTESFLATVRGRL